MIRFIDPTAAEYLGGFVVLGPGVIGQQQKAWFND